MKDLLEYGFVQNALLSMLFLSVLSGIVGTYIVVRRMVFAAGGITHASFGGIGIAYYLGLTPTVGGIVFAAMTAIGIEILSHQGHVREDSAIAMLWSLGMAMGIIFMSLSPGYAPGLLGFMMGDVLTVSTSDLWAEGIVAATILLLTTVFYRPILHVAFDAPFARLAGLPSGLIGMACAVVVAIAISLAIKSVGIILVLSVFTIPQSIAGMYTNSLSRQMIVSTAVAHVGCLGGVVMSFWLDMPAGAATTALLSLVLLIVKLAARANKK